MAAAFPFEPGDEAEGAREFIGAARRVLASTLRSVGGRHARLYRLDPDSGAFACLASTGERETSGAEAAFSRLVARGEAALGTPDVRAEPACATEASHRERPAREEPGALAAAAIRAEGAVVGTIVLADRTGRRYTERDLALLSASADRMALRLETDRLRVELARERREAEGLARVARLIGEGLDLRAVGERIADGVLPMLGAHSSAIRLLRADGALESIATGGRARESEGAEEVVPPGVGLLGRAAAEGRPVWTADIRRDDRFERGEELHDRILTGGTVAGLAVPMRTAGQVIGVLSVGSSHSRTFAAEEIDLLQRFADQAAIVIDGVRTREALAKQAERLRILHDVDRAIITETAPVAIAEAVVWRLRDLLAVPRAIVSLFDWAAGEVEWLAAVGRQRIHVGPGVRYPLRLAGDLEALRRGEPQVVDVRALAPSPEADALLASGVRVYMVVPMIAAGELIGSVSFGGAEARFPEEQVAIAREVAAQLAIALRHARLGEKLDASQAQLAQAQKMEAIGQLAGGVAHDFNNLLTVIGGRSSLLLGKLRPDDPGRRDVELIMSTAQRAASLTRQLLAFSRKQVLEPKAIDLNTLAAGVAPMLKRLIGEHIEIVIVPARELGSVMADPGQMEQVIVNLVVNARDAMPDGGTLTIETAAREVPETGLPAHGERVPPGPYVALTVRDTGSGMDAATLARIFEPFFTTKAPGKGTGLGLSTVHGIVHQSDGHLTVESAPGRGTTFTIYLPRIPEPAGATETPESPRPSLVGGVGTVLLVEDDEELRRLASEILQTAGYTVLEAGDPLEALILAEEREGAIDLLLTDMVMPAMRGPELAARLRATRPGLRVLFMSGYADEADGAVRPGEPAPAFLPKPFTPHDLTTKIRDTLTP